MITSSIIQKSHLESGHRLDAEYYQPEYLEIVEKLNLLPHKTLEDISESIVSFGAYALTTFIEWKEEGIPFIVAENIKGGFIDYEGVRYISEKTDEILKKSRVEEKHVLLAMSGSVGNAAVAYEIPSKLNSNQDIVKIKLREGFSPYFLSAFLNSRYGRLQVLRSPVGSVQQHIFLWQMKTLLIPTCPKRIANEIDKTYRNGLQELKNSKSLYSQAEQLLSEELGIKDLDLGDELFYTVSAKEAKERQRFDAEHFQPKYEKLIRRIKKQNVRSSLDVIDNVPAKFNPDAQPQEIFRYVELANVDSSIGMIDGFSEMLGKEAPSRAKRILKNGDVIVASVEGSLKKVAMAENEQEGYLASTGFFQFRGKGILPEVLLVLAKSLVLQMQLEKQTAGTILTAVPKEAIKNILVPTLPKSTQQEIAGLVRKSHEARKKSKELLDEAKQKVETLIAKKAGF